MNECVNVVKTSGGFRLEWSDGETIPGVYPTEDGAARCAEEFAGMLALFNETADAGAPAYV